MKFENQKLRKNLEKAENESLEIVKKLAELTQKNADLQHEVKQNLFTKTFVTIQINILCVFLPMAGFSSFN